MKKVNANFNYTRLVSLMENLMLKHTSSDLSML